MKTIDSVNIENWPQFEPKNIYLPNISDVDFPPEMDFSLPVCVTKDIAYNYVRQLMRVLNSKSEYAAIGGFSSRMPPMYGKSTILYLLACIAWAKESFLFYVRDGNEWLNSDSPHVYFLQIIKRQNSPQVLKKHLKKRLGERIYRKLVEQDEIDEEVQSHIQKCFNAVETVLIDDGFELMKMAEKDIWGASSVFTILNKWQREGFLGVCDSREHPFFYTSTIKNMYSYPRKVQADLDCFIEILIHEIDKALGDHDVISDGRKRKIARLALEEARGVIEIAKQGIKDLRKLDQQEINAVKETQDSGEHAASIHWLMVKHIRDTLERHFDELSMKFWTKKVQSKEKRERRGNYCQNLQEYLDISNVTKKRFNPEDDFNSDLCYTGLTTPLPGKASCELFLCDLARWSLQKIVREELRKHIVKNEYYFSIVKDEYCFSHGDFAFVSKILCSVQDKGLCISQQATSTPNHDIMESENKRKQVRNADAKSECLNLPARDVSFRVCGRNEKNLQLLFQTDSWRFVRMCLEFHPEVTIALYPATSSVKLWDVTLLHKTQKVEGTESPSYTICFFHVTTNGPKHPKELKTYGARAATEILDQVCMGSKIQLRDQRFEVTSDGKNNPVFCARFFLVSAMKMMEKSIANLEIISGDDVKKYFNVDVDIVAFSRAAQQGEIECMEKMVEGGIDVNKRDHTGKTFLFYSARYGHETIFNTLLRMGSDVNAVDEDGRTVLFYAVGGHHEGILKKLIAAGADVNIVDKHGRTVLFSAVEADHEGILKTVITAGTDVNKATACGSTALMWAIDRGSYRCVQALIDAGADVNSVDNKNYTALYYAVEHSEPNIVKILLRAGASVNKNQLFPNPYENKAKITKLLRAAGMSIEFKNDWESYDGGTDFEDDCEPSHICLKHICRDAIRKHLLENSEVNLFVQISRLGLPCLLTSFLLFHQTLEEEDDDDDDDDD